MRICCGVLIGAFGMYLWVFSHDTLDLYSAKSMLALIILIVVLGVIFSKLYTVSPGLNSLGSMTIAVLITLAPYGHEVARLWNFRAPYFQSLAGLLLALVLVPPVSAQFLAPRSNQRLERP
jgi:hypothetical protein